MKPTYEWDEEKAEKNLRKHGVSFDEAETVFDDSLAITILTPTIRNLNYDLSILGYRAKVASSLLRTRNVAEEFDLSTRV